MRGRSPVNIKEYRHLRADLTELDRLIAMTPESDVIDRSSLEARRNQVAEELGTYPTPIRWPVNACLTFNGGPVIGRHGIEADFGAKAVTAFADAVASIGASRQSPLGARGVIPNREDYRLLITGTSRGSFGFEIEEKLAVNPVQETLFPESSYVEMALEQVKNILKSSVSNDEDLADAVADVDPRALTDLRTFVKMMADNHAVCSLSLKGDTFGFDDMDQVKRSQRNLSQSNIRLYEDAMSGSFHGFLPNERKAEFVDDSDGQVISGKVDPKVDASGINSMLNRPASIKVLAKRVGASRPSYVITEISIDDA